MKRIADGIRFGLLAVAPLFITLAVTASAQEKAGSVSSAQPAVEYSIERLAVGTGIESLEPVGTGESFPPSAEKVYCFVEAKGISVDTEIHVVWFHKEKQILDTSLTLKAGPRWRTYSYKNLHGMTGDWRIEVNNANGDTVKELAFVVQ